jgi:hypothetical protein
MKHAERARRAFVLHLRAMPGVDGIKSFRALLKAALRHYGLRAIDVRETPRSSSLHPCSTREVSMSAFSERVQAQREEQKETGLFKVDELRPNKELLLTVRHIDEQVAMFGKEVDLLNFVETGRQLQLNWTTSQWLIDNLGDDPENWPGKQVVLHLAEYEYNREKKLGIRLKLPGQPSPATNGPPPQPKPLPPRKQDLDDDIPPF